MFIFLTAAVKAETHYHPKVNERDAAKRVRETLSLLSLGPLCVSKQWSV